MTVGEIPHFDVWIGDGRCVQTRKGLLAQNVRDLPAPLCLAKTVTVYGYDQDVDELLRAGGHVTRIPAERPEDGGSTSVGVTCREFGITPSMAQTR